jgi:hypothetical protein
VASSLRDLDFSCGCLNISTSAQVVFVTQADFAADASCFSSAVPKMINVQVQQDPNKNTAIEFLPFDSRTGRMIATAASLNGGNVLAALVKTIKVRSRQVIDIRQMG